MGRPEREIEDRVTFHALRGETIRIGRDLDTDDNVVFHGPPAVGDRLTVADDAMLFRADVGDDVTVGHNALVIRPAEDPIEITDGTHVPADAVITSQQQADALGGR